MKTKFGLRFDGVAQEDKNDRANAADPAAVFVINSLRCSLWRMKFPFRNCKHDQQKSAYEKLPGKNKTFNESLPNIHVKTSVSNKILHEAYEAKEELDNVNH